MLRGGQTPLIILLIANVKIFSDERLGVICDSSSDIKCTEMHSLSDESAIEIELSINRIKSKMWVLKHRIKNNWK